MAAYTVTLVDERPEIGQGGNLVETTVIFLETVMGNRGSLKIPTANYDALTQSDEGLNTLREMLQSKADGLDAPLTL